MLRGIKVFIGGICLKDKINEKNISWIANTDSLCTGCGVCIGVCPHDVISKDHIEAKGVLRPFVNLDTCTNCEICVQSCPALDFEIDKNTEDKEEKKYHKWLSYYNNTYIGHSLNEDILKNSASGGLVTTFVKYLLDEKHIDYVALSRMGDKKNPFRTVTELVNNSDELDKYQKSIYAPVMVGEILEKIKKIDGNIAIVGLPCHIAGIRKAMENNKKLKNKIKFLIGVFCSRTPTINATLSLLKDKQIKKEDVEKIDFRSLGEPSNMIVKTKSSEVIVPHLSTTYWGIRFKKFFMPPRCYLCNDKSGALADISFGDNWTGKKHNIHGSSSIITRSSEADIIINKMKNNKLIDIERIDSNTLSRSQNFHIKNDVNHRAIVWKFFNKSYIPDYELNYSLKEIMKSLNSLTAYFRVRVSSNGNRINIEKVYRFYIYKEKITNIIRKIFSPIKKVLRLVKYSIKFFIVKNKKLVKDKKYKIAMIGGYGAKDIGDEAMPHSDTIAFRKKLGDDLDIMMFSYNPVYTRSYHKERSEYDIVNLGLINSNSVYRKIKNLLRFLHGLGFIFGVYLQSKGIRIQMWKNGRIFLDELYTSDILFNVGGGNLNSIMPGELYKKCFTYWAANILNKPIIISGQTIGPFNNKIDELFAKFALNKVDLITFRDDNISLKRIKQIGVTKPIMKDTADDAVNLPVLSKDKSIKVLFNEVGENWIDLSNDFFLVMNLKGSMRVFQEGGKEVSLENEINLLANVADYMVDKYNAKVVFLPTDYCEDVDDRVIHRLIYEQIKNKKNVKLIEGEYDDLTLKGMIGLTDFAVGARYHYCIFAATMYVPFLGLASGIYQRTKLRGLADLCKLPELYFNKDMKELSLKEVINRIDSLIEDNQKIRKQLKNVVPKLQKSSLFSIEYTLEKIH